MNEVCCKNCIHLDVNNNFCRRFPPTPLVVKNRNRDDEHETRVVTKFPIVALVDRDYCGEYTDAKDPDEV